MTRPSRAPANPKHEAASGLGDPRWWAVSAVAGLGAYVASSQGLFLHQAAWQIPLFVGCVVGLVAFAPRQAIPVAAGVTLVSTVFLPPMLPFAARSGSVEWGLALVLSAAAAAAVSFVRAALSVDRRRVFGLAVSALLIAWTLVNMWAPLLDEGLPVRVYGALDASQITTVPQPGTYEYDDAVYRRVYFLMHQGEGYYPAFRDALAGRREKPPSPNLPNTVFAYRLPTYYWIWRLLPSDPFSIVYLYLALCSIGVIGGGLVAGQLVGARFAPLAAVALAAYAFPIGSSPYVTFVDLPASFVALAGVALFVRASLKGDRSALWAAAGVLTLVALTREILVYLIVLAALSSLLESPGRRLRAAIPWLCGLAVFTLCYSVHAIAASPFLSQESSVFSYFGGSLRYAWAAVNQFAQGINGHEVALAILVILGLLGAFAAHRRAGWPFAAFAVAALALPVVAMVRVGNPAIAADGTQVNYWGMLVDPLALSLWPVWALILKRET